MNVLNPTLAAATLARWGSRPRPRRFRLAISGPSRLTEVQADHVRLVCNRWGRCWRVGGYGYGYRGGWRRGWHRGYRRW